MSEEQLSSRMHCGKLESVKSLSFKALQTSHTAVKLRYCEKQHSESAGGDVAGSNSPGWDPDLDHTYMMDVIEEIGFDVSHRCYWDFGRWSDLCRVWRRAGDDLQPDDTIDFEVSHSFQVLPCCHSNSLHESCGTMAATQVRHLCKPPLQSACS